MFVIPFWFRSRIFRSQPSSAHPLSQHECRFRPIIMHLPLLVFLLALLVNTVAADASFTSGRRTENESMSSSMMFTRDDWLSVDCSAVELTMAPLCGDVEMRQYHAFVCEKQCIDAVKQLLRRKEEPPMTHAICLNEWKAINRIQASECPQDMAAFMPRAMSVSTVAFTILSAFLLFTCVS
ncbi:Aste57867_18177 [Aphanomyces stellatus]|uniref:Aste57867_18177 protein n=1 Tax=Aphanomyces stellatus TaxID=120398 RepID=A0A485LB02_9STRA|nr:hypothetical protein As57867_018115 [Aphanomyces stellatus]VFT94915.1 Aste57867_18177 [Aphanomyces stellatus]